MKSLLTSLLVFFFNFIFAQQELVKVNRSNNEPEETSIAVNPLNPNLIVASSNINNFYYSIDAGKSWQEKKINSKHGIYGDPMVHFDNAGNLYYAHLGKNSNKAYPQWIDRMVVQRISNSLDTCYEDAAIGFNKDKIQDKEWLSNDLKGNLFLSWTEFDKYKSEAPSDFSRIRFSRSIDLGHSWSKPIIISDLEGDCRDGDSTMEGATTCSDAQGNIYVCWSGLNKIWLDKSTDGGISFGKDRIIANQVNGWDVPVKNIFRANGMPFILCNNSNDHFKNRLYVNWTDTRNEDADIFLKYSDDGGENWSNDIRVNDDKLGNGADQFSNNFCIDARTGNLYVIFYDKRNSPTGAYLDVYVAMSEDGGVSWKNIRITPKPFAAPGSSVFFGDYIDIDALAGKVHPIFTVNENGALSLYTCNVNFTKTPQAHLKEDLQASLLNDSLYIHFITSSNKNSTITIIHNSRKTIFKNIKAGEHEFVINARGFYEAKIISKTGRKTKIRTVSKTSNIN